MKIDEKNKEQKRCPFQTDSYGYPMFCITSQCMAWHWDYLPHPLEDESTAEGHCGLVPRES